MKKILLITLLTCSTILSIPLYAKGTNTDIPLDNIVALVNEDVVTQSELNAALAAIKTQIEQQHMVMPPASVLQKQVLDQLINKKLELDLAKQVGIHVTDADMDKTIELIANQNHLTVSELYQRLHEEGMSTSAYRNELHEQLTMQKLQQQEIAGHIAVSPEEIDNFIRSEAWRNNGTEYHLEDILIPVADTPSEKEIESARKQAAALFAKLNTQKPKAGVSFQQLATALGGSTVQAGDLGSRKLAELPTAFAESVVHMHPNDIVGPIQTPNGFHIIRLDDTRNTSKQTPPDRKQIEQILLQRKFEQAVQNWAAKLRSQAYVEINPTPK